MGGGSLVVCVVWWIDRCLQGNGPGLLTEMVEVTAGHENVKMALTTRWWLVVWVSGQAC